MSHIDLTPPGAVSTAPNGSVGVLDEPAEGPMPPSRDWQRRVGHALRRKPALAIVSGLLVAALLAIGGAWSVTRAPTTYHSNAVMLIDDPHALATAGDDGQLLKLDGLRTKYQALVATSLIAQPVATQLHLPVGVVLANVSAVVPYQSLLMDISATGSSPRFAERLAQATASEVSSYVNQEGSLWNIPAQDRYTFVVIEPAKVATADAPSHAYALTLGAGLAFIGFAATFALVQFWRSRRDIFQTS